MDGATRDIIGRGLRELYPLRSAIDVSLREKQLIKKLSFALTSSGSASIGERSAGSPDHSAEEGGPTRSISWR